MYENYAVVKFLDENDVVGIICKQWMTSKSVCLYPNVRTNEERDKLLKQQATTEKNWLSCRIEVIKEYTSFKVACSKLRETELYSNLESESDSESIITHPRKRIKKNHLYPGEESDEELVTSQKKKLVCLPYPVPPKDNPTIHLPGSSYTSNSQVSAHLSQSQLFTPRSSSQSHLRNLRPGSGMKFPAEQEITQLEIPTQASQTQSQLFTPSADPALQSQLVNLTSTIPSQPINPECERPSQVPSSQSQLFTSSPSSTPVPALQSNLFSPNSQLVYPLGERSSHDQTLLNGKLVAWMANICDKVNQVDDKLNLVLENLAKVVNFRMSERSEDFEELKVLGILPVKDDNSFIELNKKIAVDNRVCNFLVKVLISVGGRDMRCHILNMLRRILTDDVAELYSLTGKIMQNSNSKKSFIATNVAKSIFVACQRIYKEKATEVNVREIIGEWLQQAKTRKTRRMQRQEKHVQMDVEKEMDKENI